MAMTAIDPYRYRPRPTLTAPDAAARAGVDLALARRVYRALGFPDVADDEVAFDDEDVEMLQVLQDLCDTGVPVDQLITVARVYGQSLARIADAETRLFQEHFVDPLRARGRSVDAIQDQLEPVVTKQLSHLGRALDHLHRRHLAASLLQMASASDGGETVAVAFVDLSDFSGVVQELEGEELGTLIERFEEIAEAASAARRVRIVKMIGDASMLVSSDVGATLDTAFAIVHDCDLDESLPSARAGVDAGAATVAAGDYFGPVVNRAARITSFARSGTVVVSEELLRALPHEIHDVSRIGTRKLKGVGGIRLFKVRDPRAGGEAATLLNDSDQMRRTS